MKKNQRKKKESTRIPGKKNSCGTELSNLLETNITVTAVRMTSDQKRHFDSALDVFLTELVRQHFEGKGN